MFIALPLLIFLCLLPFLAYGLGIYVEKQVRKITKAFDESHMADIAIRRTEWRTQANLDKAPDSLEEEKADG